MKLDKGETYYLVSTLLMAMSACAALAELRGDDRLDFSWIANSGDLASLLDDIVPCSMAVFLSEIIERAEGIEMTRRHRDVFTQWLTLADTIQNTVEGNEQED